MAQPAFAVSSPNFWKKSGNDVSLINPLWDLVLENLTVNGIFTLGGTISGDLSLGDNQALNMGDSLDSQLSFTTLDPGAHLVRMVLPDGDLDNLPFFVISNQVGATIAFDLFGGESDPRLVILDATGAKMIHLYRSATDAILESDSGFLRLKAPSTILMENGTTEIMRFSNDGTKTTLLAPANDYVRIGSRSTTSHSLNSEDDLLVTGELEVDLSSYFDGAATFGNTALFNGQATFAAAPKLNNNVDLRFGTGQNSSIIWNTNQTVDAMLWGLDNTSRTILFVEKADQGVNFGFAAQDDATIVLQGADATQTSERMYFQYDSTNDQGEIHTDKGPVAIGSAFGYIPSASGSYSATDNITITNGIQRVEGAGGAVTLTSTPHLVDANDGVCVILQGTSDTNTLTLQDEASLANSGMQLSGGVNMILGIGDTWQGCYNSSADDWYEVSRSDN
jgi:hypothetical protein